MFGLALRKSTKAIVCSSCVSRGAFPTYTITMEPQSFRLTHTFTFCLLGWGCIEATTVRREIHAHALLVHLQWKQQLAMLQAFADSLPAETRGTHTAFLLRQAKKQKRAT